MKLKLFFISICLFFGQMFSSLQAQSSLRLMSYNLHHCEGLDGKIDYHRLGKILRKAKADVIALQELDSVCSRTHKQYQLEKLASETKMIPSYGPAISYQGGKYGIGILSRKTPTSVTRIPLPGSREARLLLVVEFENYRFACTHLSLSADERLSSLPIILEEARKSSKPFFLAGDWNDHPSSQFIQELKKHFTILSDTRQATFPANAPNTCIDYIAVCQHEAPAVLSAGVKNQPVASDHLPIFTKVVLK